MTTAVVILILDIAFYSVIFYMVWRFDKKDHNG